MWNLSTESSRQILASQEIVLVQNLVFNSNLQPVVYNAGTESRSAFPMKKLNGESFVVGVYNLEAPCESRIHGLRWRLNATHMLLVVKKFDHRIMLTSEKEDSRQVAEALATNQYSIRGRPTSN